MGNRILFKSRGQRLMRKQAAKDKGKRMLESDKRKAPDSSAKVRGSRRKRWQTDQGNIPQQQEK
jgi:hypothetical protein